MNIQLIAIGDKMPAWVNEGVAHYSKRLLPDIAFKVVEIPAKKRGKNFNIPATLLEEKEKSFARIKPNSHIIALDVKGKTWDSEAIAKRLAEWKTLGQPIALLIGGPEGLHQEALQASDERWSLSPMTLPHPLVRIIVAEQLYRAESILKGHPYHR